MYFIGLKKWVHILPPKSYSDDVSFETAKKVFIYEIWNEVDTLSASFSTLERWKEKLYETWSWWNLLHSLYGSNDYSSLHFSYFCCVKGSNISPKNLPDLIGYVEKYFIAQFFCFVKHLKTSVLSLST